MSSASRHFAARYAEAREAFVAAADALRLEQHTHRHPMLGADGEVLAMDVARAGPADADAMLIVTSACHGVEGFAGSGVQRALLSEDGAALRREAEAAGVALLFVHALNPYGFSWLRRTTQENVDLNRNFVDFHAPLPANPAYDEIARWVVPAQWPPPVEAVQALARYVDEHGHDRLQATITAGQYAHPQGLFYGGHGPTWSHQTLRHVLQEHGRRCRRLGWIDVHTGLGPQGHGELIFAGRDDAATLARAKAWWGPDVTSIYDGSSSSSKLVGMCWTAAYDECPQAEFTGVALEFGTEPVVEILDALRGDQWLENHPEVGAPQRDAIKRRIRDAFYTDTDAWKASIVAQGLDCTRRAIAGLAGRAGG